MPDNLLTRTRLNLGHWPWLTTLLRAAFLVVVLRWLASRTLPQSLWPEAVAGAWAVFALLIAARWLSGLPDGAERARRAGTKGRSWTVRLALRLIPIEWIGLLRWVVITADGCLAWATRRTPPARTEGLRLEDRRKGFYDGMFAMNVISFVPELLVSTLMLSSITHQLWLHVAVHGLEAAVIISLLGDRWLVHAGGHVLTTTHLDLCAGARAAVRLPCEAIESIESLGKTRPEVWCSAHGVHRMDTGTVSVLDRPNVVVTLRPGVVGTWSRWQVERKLPRHLFVYLDDPAALAPAVAKVRESQAQTVRSGDSLSPAA